MKFKKIGKIFNPLDFQSGECFGEFAQSPQTLVVNNKLRVYFSTRTRDTHGEYISHIAFVEYDKNFNLIGQSREEVITKGELGCYDEHGIFPIHPFKADDKIYALISGWNRRISVPVDTGIGLAYSENNGLSFKRCGNGPILSQSLHEPFLVGDGFIIQNEGLYFMFYIFGVRWLEATISEPVNRVYKIGYATSKDLLNWRTNHGQTIIPDLLNENECQALPTVLFHNGVYHMIFCFREAFDFRSNPKNGYRLGYAISKDLICWERKDEQLNLRLDIEKDEWDSKMLCYPHLFEFNEKIYLLYNGNDFGKHGFGLAELENE